MPQELENSDLHQNYKLDLECCQKCKKPFATKELIANTKKLLKKAEYLYICPECRKNISVQSSTKYLKNKI